MAFIVFLLYLGVSYVYPGEIFPALVPLHLTLWIGVLGLITSTVSLFRSGGSPLTTVQLWCLAAFTVTMAVSLMIAEHWLGASVEVVERFGPSITMFLLALCSVNSFRKLALATGTVVLLSLMLMVQGAAAYHFGYNARMFLFDTVTRAEYASTTDAEPPDAFSEAAEEDFDSDDAGPAKRIRGLGLLHDPNDLALGFVFALPLLGSAWRQRAYVRNTLLVLVPTLALSYGVLLTSSRGGTLALAVTFWRAAANRVGRFTAAVLLIAMIGGVAAVNFGGGRTIVSASDDSARGRVMAWTEGLEMLKSSPLFGVGYGQFVEHHTLTAHNSFVLCFAETGLIGYFFWIAMLVISFQQLREIRKLPDIESVDRTLKRWGAVMHLSMVGFLTAAFFLSRTYIPMLYLVIGLTGALVSIGRNAGRPLRLLPLPMLGGLVLAAEIASVVFIYIVVRL